MSDLLQKLHHYSECIYQFSFKQDYPELYDQCFKLCQDLNFPTLKSDVAQWAEWLVYSLKPAKIFEFGSGFGLSAFRFWIGARSSLKQIVLTERRLDLKDKFESLPWPQEFKSMTTFYSGDAWNVLSQHQDTDFYLVDGEKSQYLRIIQDIAQNGKKGAVVMIDNSFWRGEFLDLDPLQTTKKSTSAIRELHDYLTHQQVFKTCFLPFADGVTMLVKLT